MIWKGVFVSLPGKPCRRCWVHGNNLPKENCCACTHPVFATWPLLPAPGSRYAASELLASQGSQTQGMAAPTITLATTYLRACRYKIIVQLTPSPARKLFSTLLRLHFENRSQQEVPLNPRPYLHSLTVPVFMLRDVSSGPAQTRTYS